MPMTPIDFTAARRLCASDEWRLVSLARRNSLAKLTATQLQGHITQARRLRDKWRDLSSRQRRDVQQAQRARGTGKAARSGDKVKLFTAVLRRFEDQFAKATATAKTAPPAKAKVKKAKSSGTKTPASPSGKTRAANAGVTPSRGKQRKAQTTAKQRGIAKSGLQSRVRGHVSARGKRQQSRRDSRR